MIKTDIAPHLIEFSVLGKGSGSTWVNSLQFGVRNTRMGTHGVVWESHSEEIREDLLKEMTCNCDLSGSRS